MVLSTCSIWHFLKARATVDISLSSFIWTSAGKGTLPALLLEDNKSTDDLKTPAKNLEEDQPPLKITLLQSSVKLGPMNSVPFVHLSLELHLLYTSETVLKASLKLASASDMMYYLLILSSKRRGWRAQAHVKEQWNHRGLQGSIFILKAETASPDIKFSNTCYASARMPGLSHAGKLCISKQPH